jgi:hypothetical protein
MPNKREYMERFGVESLPGVTEDENGLECLDFGEREAARCAENETLVSEEAINFIKSWLASLRVLGAKIKTDSGSAPVSGKTRPKYVDARGKTGGRANPKCKKIVLSDRAYAQILSETYSRIKTETGGLLLGHYENGVWYVAEATDPGINAKFTVAYHEGDEVYENHVAGVISRLYKHPLVFLGMWHRHPGSMDVFSGTDDGTNYKYAASAGNGCISALVNVDPDFRMTFYYAERDERTRSVYYAKVDVEVGDSRFENREILRYAAEEELIGRMARR